MRRLVGSDGVPDEREDAQGPRAAPADPAPEPEDIGPKPA
jgi:hypothetical protein